jgi:hypothetical protein
MILSIPHLAEGASELDSLAASTGMTSINADTNLAFTRSGESDPLVLVLSQEVVMTRSLSCDLRGRVIAAMAD